MATVIDSLIVELGLDPTKLEQGEKRAAAAWLRGRETALKHGKAVEDSVNKQGDAFKALQGRLLGIAAIFLGGMGMKEFAVNITKLTAELGRFSVQIGTAAQDVSAWEGIGRRVGATGGEIAGSMQNLISQIERFKITGQSPIIQYFNQMGIGLKTARGNFKDANDLLMDMSKWAQGRDRRFVSEWFREMGMSNGMVNLLLQGPDKLAQWLQEQKKLAPSDADIKKLTELQEAWAKMTSTSESLGRSILVQMVPALLKLIEVIDKIFKRSEEHSKFMEKSWEERDAETRKRLGIPGYTPESGAPTPPGQGGTWLERFNRWWRGTSLSPTGSARAAVPPAGSPWGGDPLPEVASGVVNRARFRKELDDNPALREKIMGIAAGENKDPKANLAVIESMMNRAAMSGTSLAAQARLHASSGINENGYYAGYDPGALNRPKIRAMIEANLQKALGGSNVSNYATDNASGGLAAMEKATGKFRMQSEYAGETFFSPGTAGGRGGPRSRAAYEAWRRNLALESGSAFRTGASAVPWVNPRMLAASNSNVWNNSKSETSIGSIAVHTQATDAEGMARDLRPILEQNSQSSQANYGQN